MQRVIEFKECAASDRHGYQTITLTNDGGNLPVELAVLE